MLETTTFEISDYLDDAEVVADYLNEVLKNGDSQNLVVALGQISKAIGMTTIAKRTGMSRTSLYKALHEDAKPQFHTVFKVLQAVGSEIEIKAVLPKE